MATEIYASQRSRPISPLRARVDLMLLGGAVAAWVSALLLLAFHATADLASQRVNVRWVSGVSEADRIRVEQQAGLTQGEPGEMRTWTYTLRDQSRDNIKRLVSNPSVEDTDHIDRSTFRVVLDRPDVPRWLRSLEEAGRALPLSLLLFLASLAPAWTARQTLQRVARKSVAITRRLAEAALGNEIGPRRRVTMFLMTTTIFTTAFGGFLRTTVDGDMDWHITHAQIIRSVDDILSPHVLFEFLLKAFHVTGLSYLAATALALGLSYGMMALLVAREMNRRGVALTAYRAFILIPAVLIASHLFLATMVPPRLYLGYFAPIAYHNPTQQLNKLFALWIVFTYYAYCLDWDRLNGKRSAGLAALCVLSALAKPSFLIAFLPTVGLYALRDAVRKKWRKVVMVSAATFAPTLIVLVLEALFEYGGRANNSVIFAPFALAGVAETAVKLPLSLAFPIVVAFAAWRAHAWTARLSFTWVFVLVATFIALAFAEGGARMMHGNFRWTAQTAAFLAYVESMLFLVGRPVRIAEVPAAHARAVGWRWSRAAWIVFAIHVICGIVLYALVFSPNWHSYMGI